MKPAAVTLLVIIGLLGSRGIAAPDKSAGQDPVRPPAEMRVWTGTDHRDVRARFIEQKDGFILLELEDGRRKSVPESWFSPRSLEQASSAAARQADRSISSLRTMTFLPIKHGRFTMGSPLKEPGRVSVLPAVLPTQGPALEVEPERKVAIRRDFWLKETEVTWTEWKSVRERASDYGYTDLSAGRNGYTGDPGGTHPVTEITWWDAVKWCNAKSQIEGRTPAYYITPAFKAADILRTGTPVPYVRWDASGYRLPTEAEWEYACREGRLASPPTFHSGQISHPDISPPDEKLAMVAWYGGNSEGNTHPVKTRQPNNFGLHDMHGNVAEWCWDWDGLLTAEDAEDPRGAETGPYRIFRGGSWADPAKSCRAAYRGNYSPIAPASCLIGFRPASGSDPLQDEAKSPDRKRTRAAN